MKKEKIVKGPRKPPKRAMLAVETFLCACNIEHFEKWMEHNLDAIAHLFAAHVVQEVIAGRDLPPVERFEEFCREVHQHALEVYLGQNQTRH